MRSEGTHFTVEPWTVGVTWATTEPPYEALVGWPRVSHSLLTDTGTGCSDVVRDYFVFSGMLSSSPPWPLPTR